MGVNKVEYGGNTLIDLSNDTVSEDTLAEGVTAHNAAGEEITGKMVSGDYIPVPATAEVGQTIRVSEVDENGKPTAWEAVDMASGELPLIFSATLEEATASIVINQFSDGTPLNLSEWELLMKVPGATSYAVPLYAYVINGDYSGLHTKFAYNDNGATNVVRYRTINAHFVEASAIAYSYAGRSGVSGDVHHYKYLPNGVISSGVNLYTYNADAPFPVGTYVEVRGK